MQGDIQLNLWLHPYKRDALASALAEQGSSIEKRMDELLYDLYTELVPQEQRNEIQKRVNAEFAAREAELEAARRYTVFRVRHGGTDEFYQLDHSETFLDVAKFLRSYLRKGQSSPSTALNEFLRDLKPVSAEQYDQLMALRMENPKKVTGVFDLNFDKQEISVVDAAGWNTYKMKDVAAAVLQVCQGDCLPPDEYEIRFWERLKTGAASSAQSNKRRMSMEKEYFEQQVNALVPWPDQKTTAELFVLGQELGEESEYGSTQDILNSLSFISRHFDAEITQGVYEIIQYGSALPDEMVAAAVHMASRDCSPQQMAQAANGGELMCFHMPRSPEEISPLAVCTVCENGKSLTRYTTHFGSFDPEAALRSAQKYAHDQQIPVTDALLSLTVDLELDPNSGARKILAHSDEAMTGMLDSCFDRCPVLAARVTFDADRSQTAVEYNPLWLELRQQQDAAQSPMELKL